MENTFPLLQGKSSHKYVNGNDLSVYVPLYVGVDKRRLGVGLKLPEFNQPFFGVLSPFRIIKTLRAMWLIEELPCIETAYLPYYFELADPVLHSPPMYLDKVVAQYGGYELLRVVRAHVLARPVPEGELERMTALLGDNGYTPWPQELETYRDDMVRYGSEQQRYEIFYQQLLASDMEYFAKRKHSLAHS